MKKKSSILLFVFLLTLSLAAQEEIILTSEYLPAPDTTWVFVPGNHSAGDSLPALIMLHGYSGNYKSWHQLIDAQKYADKYSFMIICPDGFYDSFYLNSPNKKEMQFARFFFENFIPALKKKYPIYHDKLFINGLSMGGHGAMYLFLQRPELFCSAGSSSGVLHLRYSGLRNYCLKEHLGDYATHKEEFDAFSAVNMLPVLKGSNKEIIFDCGTSDHLYKANNLFREKCDELGIKATYISQPGKHNAEYWRKSIDYHFDFFSKFCK